MDGFLICITLLVFSLASYLFWPSRFNAAQHMAVGGAFVSIVVPALILNVYDVYPQDIVDLYVKILMVGMFAYLAGMVIGYVQGKGVKTNFSYDVMDSALYEKRVIKITTNLMVFGIAGLVISYIIMGFVPMFAEDPISAKLFRGQYQAPYSRVSILYRASFYVVATVVPIACIIWYKYKTRAYLFYILAVLVLMAVSLQRSGAFMGVVLAFTIVMALKSRMHFAVLMVILIGVFVFSAFFYYLVGVRTFQDDMNVWKIITAGTPDITDHLDFLLRFDQNQTWTYGRTIYGGLIPGHYEWNPAVYTLTTINPGTDINDIGSGGLRLPLPLWGYVAFSWAGVISFSFLTGILAGFFLRLLKNIFQKYTSIVIRAIGIIGLGSVALIMVNFTQLNMFNFPPAVVCLFYLYRFRIK